MEKRILAYRKRIDELLQSKEADWEKILTKVMPYVDFFVPSVEELCYMIDKERFEEWQARAEGRDITEILDLENDIKPYVNIKQTRRLIGNVDKKSKRQCCSAKCSGVCWQPCDYSKGFPSG